MMDCTNVTKIPTPPSAKRYLPLTSLRCTITISRPGMASYRTSLLTSHSVMEMCFSCFMNTKYKCLDANCLFAINAQCLKKTRTLKDGEPVKKERLDERCISAFR